jgi:hypothetical protein
MTTREPRTTRAMPSTISINRQLEILDSDVDPD